MLPLNRRNKWTKKFIRTFISIIIFIIFVIALPPIFIFILLPIYIFRFLVGKIGPIVNKDVYKIVTARNSFVALDEVEKNPSYFVALAGILDGESNVESVKKVIINNLIEATDPATGKRIYPEITSKLIKFAGFYFWGQDEEFDIKDHVKEYKDPSKEYYEFGDLIELQKKFMTTPLLPNKPPWELIIVNNYREEGSKENRSFFLWKWHHIVADGYSFIKMSFKFCSAYKENFSNCPSEKLTNENLPIKLKEKKFHIVYFYLKFLFYSLFELVYTSVQAVDLNVFHPSMLKKRKPGIVKTLTRPDKTTKVTTLKEIGKANGVGMTTVIMAGITGGLRRFMIEQGLKVPWNIHTGLPIPVPGHPDDKLRHHYTVASVALPVGIPDSFKRLQKLEKKILTLKYSTRPLFNFLILIPLLGGLFPALMRLVNRSIYTTSVLSTFPWFKQKVSVFNVPVNLFYMDLAFYPGNYTLNITTLTYNGDLSIILTGNEEVFKSDKNMERINELIQEEYRILHDNIV